MLVTFTVLILFLLGQKYVWGDEEDAVVTYLQTAGVALVVGVILAFVFQLIGFVRMATWFF